MQDRIDRLYHMVRERQANSRIYFPLHILPVAMQCRTFAPRFGADQIITELGGLLHDIGYVEKDYLDPEEFTENQQDHISIGTKVAKGMLEEADIPEEYRKPIIDCIRTHDGNVTDKSPIENILVNDIDAFAFFQYPHMSYRMGIEAFGWDPRTTLKKICEHAEETYSCIRTTFFHDLATPLYENFQTSIRLVKEYHQDA